MLTDRYDIVHDIDKILLQCFKTGDRSVKRTFLCNDTAGRMVRIHDNNPVLDSRTLCNFLCLLSNIVKTANLIVRLYLK